MLAKSSEVSVFLRGGLGNQLFQYSAGLKISRMTGKKLILRTDLLPIQEDKIGGISRWPNQISEFSHLVILSSWAPPYVSMCRSV